MTSKSDCLVSREILAVARTAVGAYVHSLAPYAFAWRNHSPCPGATDEGTCQKVEALPQQAKHGNVVSQEVEHAPNENCQRQQEDREYIGADKPRHLSQLRSVYSFFSVLNGKENEENVVNR